MSISGSKGGTDLREMHNIPYPNWVGKVLNFELEIIAGPNTQWHQKLFW